ncbi:MFS transporter [Pseudonocardia sp. ICBG1142]|uniref:MFS transporter n=1 Tax=Pseudonocardia sp. ICBG1142 TaxID=2846760 RepID=UPI001CF6EDB1|nr:MFS transporter [Pseudonocardia sp. ICBG1142]
MTSEHVDAGRSRDHGSRPAAPAVPSSGSRFAVVWVGQFVAVTGLTVINFAAAYFTYRHDYSLLVLGVMFALPFVPFLVASVLAGGLIDRWGPRRGLMVSNVGGLLLALSLVVPLVTGSFSVWHGFVVITAVPILKALLLPAFEASVSFLVPKRHIGRANGTRMLVNGTGAVLGPVAAGLLLQSVGIGVVGVLGVVALAIAVVTLFVVRFEGATRPDTPAPVCAAS